MPTFRYRAFLCYSHQDRRWAKWLHAALETYRVPWHLVGRKTDAGEIPRRLTPIFRDREELPSATDLSRKINEALEQSANLVVICSPRSATSRWVNEEVLVFERLGRAERIFCLVIEGEPNASAAPGREAEECFAPALRYKLGPDGQLGSERTEPIAADVRPHKDGRSKARLKLIAGILDIGFDELAQRELHRRHRRMTGIAALAAAITLITGALAIYAVIARRAAERHEKQAEALVAFMLGDLNDKLGRMQRLDVMEAIDDRAMSYFKSLPDDVTDQALAQRAQAFEKIGTIRADQGHLQAAMESYRAAVQLAAVVARSAPTNSQRQLTYANEWVFIGKTDWLLGRLDAASAAFEAAQRVLRRAEGYAPNDKEMRYEIATLDNDIGHVLEGQGRLEEAAAHYQAMLRVSQSLVTGTAVRKDWETELGMAHNNLGKLALMSGDLKRAIAEYRSDDAIEAALSARDPHDNEQLENVVTAHAILGRTLALAGDIPAGISDLTHSMDLAAQLATFDPQNTTYKEDLALYEWQLGRLKRLTGDLSVAAELTRRSVAIFSVLVKSEPGNAGWQREFAEALSEQSAESRASGDALRAGVQAQAALKLLEPLLLRQPDDRALVLATANAQLQGAATSTDAATAERLRREALNVTQSVRSGRADPRLLALQTEALLSLDRRADLEEPLAQLAHCGYRDPALLAVLLDEHIFYSPQSAISADAEVE